MTRLSSDRVLAALSRFDVASTADVATALGRNNESQQRNVWAALQKLVAAGYATRDGAAGHVARYRITDAGRARIAQAHTTPQRQTA